ncbi:MAG: hypothetical protein ACK5MT_18370 [Actinomycetales bacterium]
MDQAPAEFLVRRRRRAPRYRAFIGAGVILGVLVALIATLFSPDGGSYSLGSVFGYTACMLGLIGALVGGLVAIVLDRRS